MDALDELIVNAFAKFLAADLSTDRARFGLFGIWVGGESARPKSVSESQLDRALVSRDAWSKEFEDFQNPYSDLVAFYETGASLGRWENFLLDVFGPDGGLLWRIPLKSLIEAANNSIHRTCAKSRAAR